MPEIGTVQITELWLPILIAAVLVFIWSSIVWMVLPHHKNDWGPLPDEEGLMKSMRDAGVKPGQYAFPNCHGDHKQMQEPEFQAKMNAGPMGLMIIGPNGMPNMAKFMIQWFLYTVFIGVFVAYITGHAHGPGANYLSVFQISGAAAVAAYGFGIIPQAIWFHRKWNTIWKEVFDAVCYGLLTAGAFGWMWPS